MRLFNGRLSRLFFWSAALILALLSYGCQTSTQSLFTVSGSGWCVQRGQALWRPSRGLPELAGDLVVASHEDGRCFLEFAKTPLSFVLVQTTPTNWLIQVPPRRMSFAGRRRPPVRSAWLYLPVALSGQPLPAPLRFQRKTDGGWRLENTRSGESLEGFLAP